MISVFFCFIGIMFYETKTLREDCRGAEEGFDFCFSGNYVRWNKRYCLERMYAGRAVYCKNSLKESDGKIFRRNSAGMEKKKVRNEGKMQVS